MSKAHRGAGIRELKKSGRGSCPICKRSGVKLMYDQDVSEKKFTVCKPCNAAIAHGKKQEEIAALA